MKKYTQKKLKNLVSNGAAEDITYGTNETRQQIEAVEGYYSKIGYVDSVYGCGGLLLKGHKTGKLYAITGRSQAIYIF